MATTVRRNFKNFVYNYSEAQVKVREATSNDPWGPSSTLMTQIAEMTNNVVAFGEIMQMIWRRINDHGKNWRHVYKALVLLDYLVKTGHDKVAQQCKENIYAIETLTTFQHWEAEKDQGKNVRERAKQLVALLKDDDRLKNERQKAMKARDRMRHHYGSHGDLSDNFGSQPNAVEATSEQIGNTGMSGSHSTYELSGTGRPQAATVTRKLSTEIDSARPQTAGEEELQLQLALALSKEEHDRDVKRKQNDDLRLEMALEQSQVEPSLVDIDFQQPSRGAFGGSSYQQPPMPNDPWGSPATPAAASTSQSFGDPFSPAPASVPTTSDNDPWVSGTSASPDRPDVASSDPWATNQAVQLNPVVPSSPETPAAVVTSDPWAPATSSNVNPVAMPALANDPWGSPLKPEGQNASRSQGVSPVSITEFNAPSKPTSSGGAPFSSDSHAHQTSHVGVSGSFEQLSLASGTNLTSGTAKLQPPRPKTAQDFLGDNARLVNLDQLVQTQTSFKSSNPFALSGGNQSQLSNPFSAQSNQPKVSIGKLAQQEQQQTGYGYAPTGFGGVLQPTQPGAPLMPMSSNSSTPMYGTTNGSMRPPANATTNPFLA